MLLCQQDLGNNVMCHPVDPRAVSPRIVIRSLSKPRRRLLFPPLPLDGGGDGDVVVLLGDGGGIVEEG